MTSKVVRILKIKEWMNKHVITISPEKTIYHAVKLMDEHNIGSVVVAHKNEPVGIVTERDIIRRALARDLDIHVEKVSKIMTKKLITASEDATILEVTRIMSENNFRRIIIIKNGHIAGILTAKDVIGITSA